MFLEGVGRRKRERDEPRETEKRVIGERERERGEKRRREGGEWERFREQNRDCRTARRAPEWK